MTLSTRPRFSRISRVLGVSTAVVAGSLGVSAPAAHAVPACDVAPAIGVTVTCTFNAGGFTDLVVPSGTESITIVAIGGSGGANPGLYSGGSGARVTSSTAVSAGQTLRVYVGGGGLSQGAGGAGYGTGGNTGAYGGGGGGSPLPAVVAEVAEVAQVELPAVRMVQAVVVRVRPTPTADPVLAALQEPEESRWIPSPLQRRAAEMAFRAAAAAVTVVSEVPAVLAVREVRAGAVALAVGLSWMLPLHQGVAGQVAVTAQPQPCSHRRGMPRSSPTARTAPFRFPLTAQLQGNCHPMSCRGSVPRRVDARVSIART
jgi:hypothetical protein